MEENTKVGYQRCAHQHSIFMTLEITCWPCNYMFDYEKGIESEEEAPKRGDLFWTSFFFRFPAIVLLMLGLAPSNNHLSIVEVMRFFPSATSLVSQTRCMHKREKKIACLVPHDQKMNEYSRPQFWVYSACSVSILFILSSAAFMTLLPYTIIYCWIETNRSAGNTAPLL